MRPCVSTWIRSTCDPCPGVNYVDMNPRVRLRCRHEVNHTTREEVTDMPESGTADVSAMSADATLSHFTA